MQIRFAEVDVVPYCPKCGAEVNEEMAFCPKCGASLMAEQPVDWRKQLRESRREWRERRRELRRQRREAERSEMEGEWEKAEMHEYVFLGPLIGGSVFIVFGVLLYFLVTGVFSVKTLAALFFVVIGVIIIAAAVYSIVVAERRHPRP